jgi:hypothetical protein
MGELLQKNRGDIQIAVKSDTIFVEAVEDAEEREIGFGGGLVKPLRAMGPRAVIDDVRQVSVQSECKKANRSRLRHAHYE